tara:strand:+ start:34524 stop:34949 length:426 start_codon:yes stop_codon:yes gene_type:complete
MKKIRAYLIDPKEKEVNKLMIDYDPNDGYFWKKLKGHIELFDDDLLQIISANHEDIGKYQRDSILLDEEGLLKEDKKELFLWFMFESNYYHILCGKALVIGTQENGIWCSPDYTEQDIRDRILWDCNNLHKHPRIKNYYEG